MPAPAHWLDARKRAIFASCRQLGIDETERKSILKLVAGVESTTALSLDLADKVLDHLRKAGAANPGKAAKAGKVGHHPGAPATLDREPYYQKIEALLADMQLPWAYAESIAENITGGKTGGIKRLAWVRRATHLRGIVAALMVEKKKRLKKAWAALDERLAEHGRDRDWCREQARQMDRLINPWLWNECLQTLRLIWARLGDEGMH
jgi:hypothetical protein